MNFWDLLYKEMYQDPNASRGSRVNESFRKLTELFFHRQHLSVIEVPLNMLTDERVLDLGSGAGAHSALFLWANARVISMDASKVRAATSMRGVVADMRKLPFGDNSFDVIHSNGVIHHAPQERTTVSEIHRVLRPCGRAAVMVYAKNSFLYRAVLFPIRGLLMGGLFRKGNWLGRATEWMSDKPQEVFNPYTSVFTGREARKLFRDFRYVSIRKNAFVFEQIPVVGKWMGRMAGRWTGYNEAGILLYGRPWRNETRFELWLGKYIGWGLNILAVK